MGRSPKMGLDYFRLDVNQDDKIDLIEAEFGLTGFAVVVRLYQRIYGGAGYYCDWNDAVAMVFASRNKVSVDDLSNIIEAALRWELFDPTLFEQYHILTSAEIQQRYFDAVSRRSQLQVIPEYLLVSADILPNRAGENAVAPDDSGISADENAALRELNSISADINPLPDDFSAISACKSTQSKEKESKVNHSTVNHSTVNQSKDTMCAEPPDSGRSTLEIPAGITQSEFNLTLSDGSYYNVPKEQIEVYKQLYPGVDVEQALRNMMGWCQDAGPNRKTRKGIKKFITSWLIRTQDGASRRGGIRSGSDYNEAYAGAGQPRQLFSGEIVL